MTAEVAILNTHGIALATDSAVTVLVGNEKKVYNTANKLFMLSKYHPVGIMVYNKADYMGIDWEIIIKEYRKSIKKPSDKLSDYAKNFINYVKEYTFITEERQKDALLSICVPIILGVRKMFFREIENKSYPNGKVTLKQSSQILDSVIKNILEFQIKNTSKANYTFDTAFLKRYKNDIYKIIDSIFEKHKTSDKQKESILKIIISDFSKAYELENYSGIVIAGYGDKEIFPSIYQCEICGKIGKSFVLFNERNKSISSTKDAFIAPFAQREMVYTFMQGIDPDLKNIIDKQLEKIMISISDIIGNSHKDKLMYVKKEFMRYLYELQGITYTNPIMDIVQSLQKTDLAEMAETLVNLTAFKRHVSKDAETVGGPTDVAVITKGDGFVWIKRKQYFDIKFNPFFQKNYFMEDVK